MFLIGVHYVGEPKSKAVMRFVENGQIVSIDDPFNHHPYFFTDDITAGTQRGIATFENVTRRDRMLRKDVQLRKVICEGPSDVAKLTRRDGYGNPAPIPSAWENNIKYQWCYIADTGMMPSIEYVLSDGKPVPCLSLVDDDRWMNLLGQPIPDIPMLALDIEVQAPEEFPHVDNAIFPIKSIALVSPKGKTVLINSELIPRVDVDSFKLQQRFKAEIHVLPEVEMLKFTYRIMEKYPVILTFSNTDFDLGYMVERSMKLGMTLEDEPMFKHGSRDFGYWYGLKDRIHLDICSYLSNETVQTYVYSGKYKYPNLNDVGMALLGRGKIGEFRMDMTVDELVEYNLNDAQLLYDLMNYSDREMFRIMVAISRISKIPIEDIVHYGTNKWIQCLQVWEHRKRDCLIPNRTQLKEVEAATKAIIKGKKYKGAAVLDPKKGLHFGVKCLDAASLYPTILARKNLSYETIMCPHEECQSNKVPFTEYWVCTKERGIIADVIQELRDLRVNKIKPRAKSDPYWLSVAQALKTIMNATYGVFGWKEFFLYWLPMAESITAYGREMIERVAQESTNSGLDVLYGDTDSIMVIGADDKIKHVMEWAGKNLDVELELDKDFVWLALSDRKKNYLGYTTRGNPIIAGLQGKKSNTPPYVASDFQTIVDILKPMKGPSDLRVDAIRAVASAGLRHSLDHDLPIDQYAFHIEVKAAEYKTETIGKDGKKRTVTKPQHIRALEEFKGEAKIGMIAIYVKTTDGPKMVQIADINKLDIGAYVDNYRSNMEQVFDALGLKFSDMAGIPELVEFIPEGKPNKGRKASICGGVLVA